MTDRLTLKKFFENRRMSPFPCSTSRGHYDWASGHPSLEISIIDEMNQHAAKLLKEMLNDEKSAIALYKKLLKLVEGKSIFIEEYAREMIKSEELQEL